MWKDSGLYLSCGHGCRRLESRESKGLCNLEIQETEKSVGKVIYRNIDRYREAVSVVPRSRINVK